MADQGRWFKLWCSSLNDIDIENLSLEDYARWVKLALLVKQQGDAGTLHISSPAFSLQNIFRVTSFEEALKCVRHMPNVVSEEIKSRRENDASHVTSVIVTFKNWRKYQHDSSAERMRRKRKRDAKSDALRGEEKRGEQKRREITPLPPKGGFDLLWARYPSKTNSKAARRHYAASVKVMADFLDIQKALENYLRSERVQKGFIQNGSTWFNNWRDWINYEEKGDASNGGTSVSEYAAIARANREAAKLREKESTGGTVSSGVRDLSDVRP